MTEGTYPDISFRVVKMIGAESETQSLKLDNPNKGKKALTPIVQSRRAAIVAQSHYTNADLPSTSASLAFHVVLNPKQNCLPAFCAFSLTELTNPVSTTLFFLT